MIKIGNTLKIAFLAIFPLRVFKTITTSIKHRCFKYDLHCILSNNAIKTLKIL